MKMGQQFGKGKIKRKVKASDTFRLTSVEAKPISKSMDLILEATMAYLMALASNSCIA